MCVWASQRAHIIVEVKYLPDRKECLQSRLQVLLCSPYIRLGKNTRQYRQTRFVGRVYKEIAAALAVKERNLNHYVYYMRIKTDAHFSYFAWLNIKTLKGRRRKVQEGSPVSFYKFPFLIISPLFETCFLSANPGESKKKAAGAASFVPSAENKEEKGRRKGRISMKIERGNGDLDNEKEEALSFPLGLKLPRWQQLYRASILYHQVRYWVWKR